MTLRCAVGLPNVGEFGDPLLLVELAVLAEEHGWDGVYLWDHVLHQNPRWPVANPTVTAAAIVARTSAIRLIVMHVLPRRQVQAVARETVALDVLSGGRLTVAAAIGSLDLEYTGFGASADLRERGAALDAGLADLCALWSGEPVSIAGGPLVQMLPTPVQQPRIPIWCGGRWPARKPLRRAARFDGAMPIFADQNSRVLPPTELAEVADLIIAERGGLDGFDLVLEGATEPATGAALVSSYESIGLTWWIEAMGWWRAEPGGAAGAVRARIAAGPPR